MLQDACQTVNKAGRKTRILALVLSGGGRHHIINVCSMVTYPTEKNVAKRKVGNPSEVICSVRLKKGSLTDQVAFAQRNERQDRIRGGCVNTWEKRCPERRNSKFKDPEVGAGPLGSWNSRNAHGRIVEREPVVRGGFREPLSIELHVVLQVKNLSASAGDIRDVGAIPRLERCPGGGHGNPLQYSCLENLMDRGAWQATVDGVAKSQTRGAT